MSSASRAEAIVDLPDDGRPVSHTVPPLRPSAAQRCSRVTAAMWRTTFSLRGPAAGSTAPTGSTTMPAATVAFVCSSMRMNAPVARFSAYGSSATRLRGAQAQPPDVVELQRGRGGVAPERVDVDRVQQVGDRRAGAPRRGLQDVAPAGPQRPLVEPAHVGDELAHDRRRGHGARDDLPARDVEVVGQADRHGHRRARPRRAARRRCRCRRPASARRWAARRRPRRRAASRRPRGPRSRGSRGGRRRAGARRTAPAGARGRARGGRRRRRPPRGSAAAAARRTSPSPRTARRRCRRAAPRPGSRRRRRRPCGARTRGSRRRSAANVSSSKSTRSILLTTATTCGTRRSEAMKAWRRDCSSTPWRASMSTSARSAVDAPVTMLRV